MHCLALLLILTVHIHPLVWSEVVGSECATPLVCRSETEFSMCSIIDGETVISSTTYVCPAGYVCVENELNPCQIIPSVPPITTTSTTASPATTSTSTKPAPTTTTTPRTITTTTSIANTTSTNTTTSSATTSTPSPVTPPACTVAGNHPAPQCNQYYECIKILWWYEAVLQTCPSGQAFDAGTSACVNTAQTNCAL